VSVVGAVGEDFKQSDLDLLAGRGVDVSAVERLPGKTFRWAAKYSDDMNDRVTLSTELGVFADFKPVIKEAHRKLPYLFLGNIDPDLQRQVRESVVNPRLVACDTMNFWIEGRREALERTLRVVDLLMINDSEAKLLSGEGSLLAASRKIRSMGPKTLVAKRGEYGAVIFGESSIAALPAMFLDGVVDPTGAGDSFAGGVVGCLAALDRIDEDALRLAVAAGTVMASFTVQGFGVKGLVEAAPREIAARAGELMALVGGRPIELPLKG